MEEKIKVLDITYPEGTNIIIGRTHFIKSVEDIYEAIVETNPNIKFGLAFNEASQKRLIRIEGNDKELIEEAVRIAKLLNSGHVFVLLIKEGWPINIIPRLKQVAELLEIMVATANPLKVVVFETERGNAILGFVDGYYPRGVEGEEDIKERKEFLRKIGYKR